MQDWAFLKSVNSTKKEGFGLEKSFSFNKKDLALLVLFGILKLFFKENFLKYIHNDINRIISSIKNINTDVYDIRRGVEIGSFIINLAIYDKKTNKYMIGIECSESKNDLNEKEISDDIYRQYYLEIRGWNIYKVWVTDWFRNKEEQIRNIVKKIGAEM